MIRNTSSCLLIVFLFLSASIAPNQMLFGDEKPTPNGQTENNTPEKNRSKNKTEEIPDKLIPLNKKKTVLIDRKGNRLLLKTKVVLREGVLEMLGCLRKTKEHESILSLDAKAYIVHAGLLALKSEPGKPARFYPKASPATGPRIDVFLQWKDEQGTLQRVPAQKWIRYAVNRYFVANLDPLPKGFDLKAAEKLDLRYDKFSKDIFWFGQMTDKMKADLTKLSNDKRYLAILDRFQKESTIKQMDTHWIFTGSGFAENQDTGEQYYEAEDGCLICVANMPTAMMDVAIESSSTGSENLLFEAHTPNIPPYGTEVTIELIPAPIKKEKK